MLKLGLERAISWVGQDSEIQYLSHFSAHEQDVICQQDYLLREYCAKERFQ